MEDGCMEPDLVHLLDDLVATVESSVYFVRGISYKETKGSINGTIGTITIKIED